MIFTRIIQVFAHTNDLNEKDNVIIKLKKRQISLENIIAANEKLHEQDAIVRLQLGKRLEQVLLDKEEAYEELDLFKVRYACFTILLVFSFSNLTFFIFYDGRKNLSVSSRRCLSSISLRSALRLPHRRHHRGVRRRGFVK